MLAAALPALAEDTAAGRAAAEDVAANVYTVGGSVAFGRYEQDNDKDNGKEPVEWIVLAVDGGRALLLSKYGLDAYAYSDYSKKITWSQSTIRLWLNYSFIKELFTPEDRKRCCPRRSPTRQPPGMNRTAVMIR